jgi:hypothetical protein
LPGPGWGANPGSFFLLIFSFLHFNAEPQRLPNYYKILATFKNRKSCVITFDGKIYWAKFFAPFSQANPVTLVPDDSRSEVPLPVDDALTFPPSFATGVKTPPCKFPREKVERIYLFISQRRSGGSSNSRRHELVEKLLRVFYRKKKKKLFSRLVFSF